mgnify:CR=1 FL=1
MKPIFFIVIFVPLVILSPSLAFSDSISGSHGFDAACKKYTPDKVVSCSVQTTSDGLKVTKDTASSKTGNHRMRRNMYSPISDKYLLNFDRSPHNRLIN